MDFRSKTTLASSIMSEKIADAMLGRFLEEDTNNTVDVLLEIEAPDPVVTYKQGLLDDKRIPEAVEYSDDAYRQQSQVVEATRLLLESMKITYRFSPSARVFAIAVTPGQLRALISDEAIRAVVPNRRVKM